MNGMTKTPKRGTVPRAIARSTSLDRYYLHGDASESEPGLFYCKACDWFLDAEHFSRDHAASFANRDVRTHGELLRNHEHNVALLRRAGQLKGYRFFHSDPRNIVLVKGL